MTLYNGLEQGNNVEVNLQSTLSWTPIWRVGNPSPVLTGKSGPNLSGNINGNQGDLDFQHGLVSNELEVLEVLDFKDGSFGAHFSGEAYLNTSYLGSNQNEETTGPNSTYNPISNSDPRSFTSATRNVNGENARLLDAFVYGSQPYNDGNSLFALKIGRQTLQWGQSLFLATNGIAGGMAPIDAILAQNTVNPETQQVLLPVGQAVATWQINPTYTLQGYYQFEWAPYNLQGVGSYFSSSDVLDKGGQSLILGYEPAGIPGVAAGTPIRALRTKDIRPPSQNGQFGLSLQATYGNYDVGIFGLRFDSKTPTLYFTPSFSSYKLVYPRDIWIEGTSLSTTVGPANVAGEISFRQHMNLTTGGNPSATNNANSNPAYPVGSTMAAQVSTTYLSPGLRFDPGGISVAAEVGLNHVLNITANNAALTTTPLRTRTAAEFVGTVTPQYLDVLPHLTVNFPIGIDYDFYGRSMVNAAENHGTGDVNFGVQAVYDVVYSASITYQQYFGAANTALAGEPSEADRSFVIANLQYTF